MKTNICKRIIMSTIVILLLLIAQPHNAVSAPPLFQDGFESGNLSKWDFEHCCGDVTINTNPKFVHSGKYSLRLRYYACSTEGCGTKENQSINRYVQANYFSTYSAEFPNGVEHFIVSGWLYIPSVNLKGDPVNPDHKRKLIYLKGPNNEWRIGVNNYQMRLEVALRPPKDDDVYQAGDYKSFWPPFNYKFDRWHHIKLEVSLNTPGSRDGFVTVWIDDGVVFNKQKANLRGLRTEGIHTISIGNQASRRDQGWVPIDEERYWDDIAIITNKVTSDTTPPVRPIGLKIVQ